MDVAGGSRRALAVTTKRRHNRVLMVTAKGEESKVKTAKESLTRLRHERDLVLSVPRLEARRDALMEELKHLQESLRIEREAYELDLAHDYQGLEHAREEGEAKAKSLTQAAHEEADKANKQIQIRLSEVQAEEKRIEERISETRKLEAQAEEKASQAEKKLSDAELIETKAKTLAEQINLSRIDVDNRWTEFERARADLEQSYETVKKKEERIELERMALAKEAKRTLQESDDLLQRRKQIASAETSFRNSSADLSSRLAEADKMQSKANNDLTRGKELLIKASEFNKELQRQIKIMDAREKRNLIMEADLRAEKTRVEKARAEAKSLFLLIKDAQDGRK